MSSKTKRYRLTSNYLSSAKGSEGELLRLLVRPDGNYVKLYFGKNAGGQKLIATVACWAVEEIIPDTLNIEIHE